MGTQGIPSGEAAWYPPLIAPPYDRHKAGWEPTWWPVNAAQQAFLDCRAELALFGGQSGGGKTSVLAADAVQEYRNPWLRSLVLRRTLSEFQEMADQMQRMYEPLGARWRRPTKFDAFAWTFPSGASITPGYLRNEKDLDRYQGNPKSHIGLDESGQHPERVVRKLLGWMAAPRGRGLFVRARFASNPGGPGHGWQMAVFLRGKCPVHFPAGLADNDPRNTSVLPGKVYRGAKWPSDSGLVHKTTAFFPARLADNPFYDRVKLESLLTQTAEIRNQLLYGCWCNAEGLYFPFLRPEHMRPFQEFPVEWWWGHVISHDWGYGSSAAAAGMYAITPTGQAVKIREQAQKKMGSVEFAKRICKDGFEASENPPMPKQAAWLEKLKPSDPQPPRILFAVFDPANDQHTGTGRSNFELMSAVYAKHGVSCILGAHDPVGNAQHLYGGLSNQSLVITSACPATFRSLQSRTIDERNAVKKVKGDPLDDLYDETAYFWNTWLTESVKPRRLAVQEELDKLRREGMDETSLARVAWQREQDLRREEQKEAHGMSLTGKRIGRRVARR